MTWTGSTTSSATATIERPDRLLPCAVDEVIVSWNGVPRVFTGRGPGEQRWLVAQIAESPHARRWLCAPASDRAISCALSGRAEPLDLFRHSASGSVEDITINDDGESFEATWLCGELTDVDVRLRPGDVPYVLP